MRDDFADGPLFPSPSGMNLSQFHKPVELDTPVERNTVCRSLVRKVCEDNCWAAAGPYGSSFDLSFERCLESPATRGTGRLASTMLTPPSYAGYPGSHEPPPRTFRPES